MFAIIELKKTPIATVLSRTLRALLAASLAAGAGAAYADEVKLGETTFTWGGYVKADVIYSQYSEGDPTGTNAVGSAVAGRDFYLPSTIPVTGGKTQRGLDFHAKQTRLWLITDTTWEGLKVGTHIETDFITSATSGGSERTTNGYTPALRRAFIKINNKWTVGQDWSTFQNLVALPENLDFVEWPTDGTVFIRQSQIRYTAGNVDLAVENPQTTVSCAAGFCGAASTVTDDNRVPDLVARYKIAGDFGAITLAGLVRELRADNGAVATGIDDNTFGGGVSLAGKVNLGADDIRFTVTGGEGIGRYVALNLVNDAEATAADPSLDTVSTLNGFAAYRHVWDPKWRSTLTVSAFRADNGAAFTASTKAVNSGSLNLLYSPVPRLTCGAELRYVRREDEAGNAGELYRAQFSTKFTF